MEEAQQDHLLGLFVTVDGVAASSSRGGAHWLGVLSSGGRPGWTVPA